MVGSQSVLGVRLYQKFQASNPITNLMSRTSLTRKVGQVAFRAAAKITGLAINAPGASFIHGQFQLASLRLACPDILKIPTEGISIGGGIMVRSVPFDELETEAKPHFNHVRLLEITGTKTGLHAYIGVHSLILYKGRPTCIGGCRIRNDYKSLGEAQRDVLRLSEAMANKNATADVMLGGGKCDIMADPKADNIMEILADFGQALEYLQVIFTGQDMNHSKEMATLLSLISPHGIVGVEEYSMRGIEPTPPTAKGVFEGIKGAAKVNGYKLNSLRVSLQGLGGVGANLVPYLVEAGVKLTVTDVRPEARQAIREKYGDSVTVLDNPEDIYSVPADLFSTSAKEDVLNDATIPLIHKAGVKMIVGAANNPLRDKELHGKLLQKLGIFFYSDFVVNSGGLIGVASGALNYDPMVRVARIGEATERLHELMVERNLTGPKAGEELVRETLASWNRMVNQNGEIVWIGPDYQG